MEDFRAFIRHEEEEKRQTGTAAAWIVLGFIGAVIAIVSWVCGFLSGLSAP